jgi:hypothetical protein
LVSLACAACSRTHDRDVQSRPYVPTAAEQRRIDERRAEQRLADERAEERREEVRRAEEQRAADRRADERAKRRERAIGGGPTDRVVRPGPASASETIAAARCDREIKCNRVGAHGKYPSRGACVAELKREVRAELRDDTCANGVREKELNDCLQAIRADQCANALDLDAVIRMRSCRTDNLCVR